MITTNFIDTLSTLNEGDIKQIQNAVLDSINSGNADALKLFTGLRVLDKIITSDKKAGGLLEQTRELAINEFFKHSEKEQKSGVLKGNWSVTIGNRSEYEYQDDPILEKLLADLETTKAAVEQRKERLKLAIVPNAMLGIVAEQEVNPETGELFELKAAVKKVSQFLTVKAIKDNGKSTK
jgi:hypothetical protein